jgi:methyltransferase (TIGR00027 family)
MASTPSRTAEQVALFRALESGRRGERLFADPYAKAFLGRRYRMVVLLGGLPRVGEAVPRYIDRRWSGGPRASAVVRTRLIDDQLADAIAAGARQVLVLGAGYDSRGYRLPVLSGLPVFEVDAPATQAAKRWRLRRVASRHYAHVRFVPVDLERDDVGVRLRQAGFARRRTAVVWEGVTNYLSAEAVDVTLRWLAASTAPGSRVIFTYVDRGVLDGTGCFAGLDTWYATVRAGGEQWTFGFDPPRLPDYLAQRGMALLADTSAREAAERYLVPLGRREPTADFYRIAQAEVVPCPG